MSEYTDLKNRTHKITEHTILFPEEAERRKEELIEALYKILVKN